MIHVTGELTQEQLEELKAASVSVLTVSDGYLLFGDVDAIERILGHINGKPPEHVAQTNTD
jgi:hypothetical protein